MSLRIVISAGEVSGDRHLAKVVSALKASHPGCEVRGMAGPECQRAGAELLVDCYRTGATMGFAEIVRSLSKIFASFKTISKLITEWRPHLVVLVDYPDFNLRLAKVAHKAGIKVLYYIPPKVWAWRSGRVSNIKESIDRVAAIFPFEQSFYSSHGYQNVTYVGNPLGDRLSDATRDRSNTLLLLPGSRKFEVERILPPMLRVFERVRATRPGLSARVVAAPNMNLEVLKALASTSVSPETCNEISWSQGDALEEMRGARAGILKSGTCNLEGAVAGLPFVSVYSGSMITKVIVSCLVRMKEYSPVNIMRPGTVPEVFAVTIDETALEREVVKVLDDGAERELLISGLAEVRESLKSFDSQIGMGNCTTVAQRVAHLIATMSSEASASAVAHGHQGAENE
jgi:lipid-A-disaccharide synthase